MRPDMGQFLSTRSGQGLQGSDLIYHQVFQFIWRNAKDFPAAEAMQIPKTGVGAKGDPFLSG